LRIINRYLTQDFMVIFALTLLIFTFVMCIGVVLKAIDFAARGVSGGLILRVFFYNIPYMLVFSIPMSVLTAVLLLFGRLSFDGELTALKAGGVSLWQVISPAVMLSIVFSLICVFINAAVAPRCRHAVRNMLSEIGAEEPINLLEAGRFVRDFPGYMIYVGDRSGASVEDIVVYEMGAAGPARTVRAKTGKLRVDKDTKVIYIDLFEVRIDSKERDKSTGLDRSHYLNAERYPVKLDFSEVGRKSDRRKVADMTFVELVHAIRDVRSTFPELDYEDLLLQRMTMVVEANKRLALALSCFAFTLIGVPLGMKSKRKESSVGIGISLLLVFIFYLFIIIANSLVGQPHLRPDLIVWIPVVAAEVIGFFLLAKAN
jgi:lipopolysaccharide export system permease protein